MGNQGPWHCPTRRVPAPRVGATAASPQSASELWQWLWALRQASSANGAMLPTCHPGAFRTARWTCCLQPNRAAPGCSRTHSAVALDEWSDPLDPAAAAQSLYGHLQRAGTRLWEVVAELEGSVAVQSPGPKPGGGAVAERLRAVLRDLDVAHEAFAGGDGVSSPPTDADTDAAAAT